MTASSGWPQAMPCWAPPDSPSSPASSPASWAAPIHTLRQPDSQIAGLNLILVSTGHGHAAQLGTDGGVFVGRPTVSSNTPATSGPASFSLNLDSAQFSGDHVVPMDPMADPGALRWWLISKTPSHLTVG